MLKNMAFSSVANLFVIMVYIEVVCCQLPSNQVVRSSQLPLEQVNAMNKIYDIIQSDACSGNFRWNTVAKNSSDPCSWLGVGCSSDNSSINHIYFSSSLMSTSEFLPYLCNITTLESLDVSNNRLASIPRGFFIGCGYISGLKVLNFSGNNLNGYLPTFNGGFRVLETLDFSRNNFSGEISLQLEGLGSLKYLDLGFNNFEGKIPTNLGKMNVLEELDLSHNYLSGGIPSSLSNITTLRTLSADDNNLNGTIPSGITWHLKYLSLTNNKLRGVLPSDLLSGPHLQSVNLSNNNLNGMITLGSHSHSLGLISLDLRNNTLNGRLPPALGNLTNLQRLDMRGNKLQGPIPDTLGDLSSLVQLYLANNQLEGVIPYDLAKARGLQVLDLSNNRLSGTIPDSLTHLRNLTLLLLMNNHLSGLLPNFPFNVEVDVAGNKDLNHFGEDPSPAIPHRKRRKPSLIDSDVVIAAASGFPVGLFISVIAILISRRYKSINGKLSTPNSIHTPNVDFKKAMEAVADPSNIIFKTAFSTFYKFVMPSDTTYLVKKVNHSHNLFQLFPRHKQLVEEMEAFGSLSNPNTMIPVAYVLTLRRAYIFYDFARGTLHDVLHHKNGNKLEWGSRYNIAVGVAKGLAYLHECSSGPIILLDLCSKSILLKSLDEPQISDIELSKLVHPSNSGGSAGYVPPEYGSTRRVTAAGNVYSFGVILLELLTGKPTVTDEETKLAKQASHSSNWDEILDSSMISSDASVGVRTQMAAVVEVALACLNISPEERPNAVTVLQLLCTKPKIVSSIINQV